MSLAQENGEKSFFKAGRGLLHCPVENVNEIEGHAPEFWI